MRKINIFNPEMLGVRLVATFFTLLLTCSAGICCRAIIRTILVAPLTINPMIYYVTLSISLAGVLFGTVLCVFIVMKKVLLGFPEELKREEP